MPKKPKKTRAPKFNSLVGAVAICGHPVRVFLEPSGQSGGGAFWTNPAPGNDEPALIELYVDKNGDIRDLVGTLIHELTEFAYTSMGLRYKRGGSPFLTGLLFVFSHDDFSYATDQVGAAVASLFDPLVKKLRELKRREADA